MLIHMMQIFYFLVTLPLAYTFPTWIPKDIRQHELTAACKISIETHMKEKYKIYDIPT